MLIYLFMEGCQTEQFHARQIEQTCKLAGSIFDLRMNPFQGLIYTCEHGGEAATVHSDLSRHQPLPSSPLFPHSKEVAQDRRFVKQHFSSIDIASCMTSSTRYTYTNRTSTIPPLPPRQATWQTGRGFLHYYGTFRSRSPALASNWQAGRQRCTVTITSPSGQAVVDSSRHHAVMNNTSYHQLPPLTTTYHQSLRNSSRDSPRRDDS